MTKELKLEEGYLDDNLRPLKINGEKTSLEIAKSGARVSGGLEVNGTGKPMVAEPLTTGNILGVLGSDGVTLITIGARKFLTSNTHTNLASLLVTMGYGTSQTVDFDMDGIGGAGPYMRFKSILDSGDYFQIGTTTDGVTTIATVDDDAEGADLVFNIDGYIDMNSASGEDITFDSGGKITLDSASGGFEMHGAGTTAKFADMYAGMILGYTSIAADATMASESLGTSFAVTDATHKVTFIAPPSGNVEISVSVYADQVSSVRWLQLGLSDNATYNALDVTHEHFAAKGDETDEEQVHHEWVITGLTAGTEYEYWLGAKSQSAGAYVLYWGGDVSGKFQPFVMKATALPATIYTG